MSSLSRDEYAEIFSKLPENVQDALLSLDTVNIIQNIGTANKLDEKGVATVTDLVGDLLMGLINETDFQNSLGTSLKINSGSAAALSQDVINKIYKPLKIAAAETKNKPNPTDAKTQQSTSPSKQDSPFILHEENTIVRPRLEDASISSPIRPIFYTAPNITADKKTDDSESYLYKPVKARLELGTEEQPQQSNKPEPTLIMKPGEIRRINYSELKTKLDDPFAAQNKQKNNSLGDKDKQEKVADLKDLPL